MIASNGTELTSSNNAAWHFEVPMNVKYTVDIKPVTAGGTPTIGGNNTPVDVPKISEVNKEFSEMEISTLMKMITLLLRGLRIKHY